MRRIEKRLWPDGFKRVLAGQKTYELRLGDFDVEEGDLLILREWDPETSSYTGRSLERRVGHVGRWTEGDLEMYWTAAQIRRHGLQAISLLPTEEMPSADETVPKS